MDAASRPLVILAAEVADCTRLIDTNEDGGTDRLQALCRDFIDSKLAEHKGRVARTLGQALLVEFAEPIDAVRCAINLQRRTLSDNPDPAPDRRIALRIGISTGEMKATGDDLVSRAVAALRIDELATLIKPGTGIYGDAIAAALTLASLAEPGGLCISGPVRDAVHGQFPYALEDIGDRKIGIGAIPVRCYRASAKALAARPQIGVEYWRRFTNPVVGVRGAAIAGGVIATVGVWAVALWAWQGPHPSKAPSSPPVAVQSQMPSAGGKDTPRAAPQAVPSAKTEDANREEAALQPPLANKAEADGVREAMRDAQPQTPVALPAEAAIGAVVVKGANGLPPATPDGGATGLRAAQGPQAPQTAPDSVPAVFRGNQGDAAPQTSPESRTAVVRGSQAPTTPQGALGGVPEVVRGGRPPPKT